jgi:hypothetical protein
MYASVSSGAGSAPGIEDGSEIVNTGCKKTDGFKISFSSLFRHWKLSITARQRMRKPLKISK